MFGPKREEAAEEVGQKCIMRSLITCTLHQTLLGWSNQDDDTGRACRTRGRDEKWIQYLGWKISREETT